MLHLVFQSPIETAVLERIASGDDVVFMENAVLRIMRKGKLSQALTPLLESNSFYVLEEDMAVRGIVAGELISGIAVIDYAGLVALTVKNPVIQSWS